MESANLQSHLSEGDGVCQLRIHFLEGNGVSSTCKATYCTYFYHCLLVTGKIYRSAFHVTFVSIYYISLELASKLLLATKRAPIEEMWILIGQYLIEDNLHWFSNGMVCKKK
jgi:hypothetical protein